MENAKKGVKTRCRGNVAFFPFILGVPARQWFDCAFSVGANNYSPLQVTVIVS